MVGKSAVFESATELLESFLQQIETSNPIEARCSRYAQYRGMEVTLTFGHETVPGCLRAGGCSQHSNALARHRRLQARLASPLRARACQSDSLVHHGRS